MNIRRIYAVLGASGSGKTTALNYLASRYSVRVITKWTTRRRRDNDGPEIVSVHSIPDDCDVRYVSYGIEYGVKSADIWEVIKAGCSGAVVLNDIRTLKLLKRKLGGFLHTVYVHANVSPEELLKEEGVRYGAAFGDDQKIITQRRIEKIKAVHRKYIENISIFDSVIINVFDLDVLFRQIDKIHLSVGRGNISLSKAKCFIVCGNSFSGKDSLAAAMMNMETGRVEKYSKATDRERRLGEAEDLIHFAKGSIPKNFDVVYQKQGYSYGIAVQEIWKLLESGRSAVLVLNDFSSIGALSGILGDLAVRVFIHANMTRGEAAKLLTSSGIAEEEVALRLDVARELEMEFVDMPELFDHVLLNTTEMEDLYDQAFNLFDSHCGQL